MTSKVVQLHSTAEVQAHVRDALAGKLVVAYFTAAWCGPCQQIRPRVDQLSIMYPHVAFVKIDIDELPEVASAAGVRAVPFFELYKSGQRLASFAGADVNRLEALVKQHQGTATSESEGAASAAGANSSSAAPAASAGGLASISDLSGSIDKLQSSCLNQSSKHPFSNVLVNSDSYVESDADEQLLLDFHFQQPVRLHSIKITAKNKDTAPKMVKLFCNRINMGFDEAESSASTQEFELTETNVKADAPALELRYVKFPRVNNLVIFVKSNQGGDDVTQIHNIMFFGQTIEATDMKELKKPEHHD